MTLTNLACKVKRRYDVLWVDVRFVELLGHRMWHVSVNPLHGSSVTVASQHRSPRRALRAALKSTVTLPSEDAHEGSPVTD